MDGRLEVNHIEADMKESKHLSWLNELGTGMPKQRQCCREGFWQSSLLVLLMRLKNDPCLHKREQISRARNVSRE